MLTIKQMYFFFKYLRFYYLSKPLHLLNSVGVMEPASWKSREVANQTADTSRPVLVKASVQGKSGTFSYCFSSEINSLL